MGKIATPDQQLAILIRDVLPVLQAVAGGYFTYDPSSDAGHSGSEDAQSIRVRMTLGDYRRAVRLRHELERA